MALRYLIKMTQKEGKPKAAEISLESERAMNRTVRMLQCCGLVLVTATSVCAATPLTLVPIKSSDKVSLVGGRLVREASVETGVIVHVADLKGWQIILPDSTYHGPYSAVIYAPDADPEETSVTIELEILANVEPKTQYKGKSFWENPLYARMAANMRGACPIDSVRGCPKSSFRREMIDRVKVGGAWRS
jgi:hypothetical protein